MTISDESDELLQLFNDEQSLQSTFQYSPTTDTARELYATVGALCSELGIAVTKVYESFQQYHIDYFLKTDGRYAGISFLINKAGYVTYAKPFSDLGEDDHKLVSLTQKLRQ